MIIPAIDLIDGAVVRLFQGDYAQKTEYQKDPVAVVHDYADAGASWLHIVDLTGAKAPEKRQLELIKRMVDTKRMQFQAGGGIRSEQEVVQLLESGVSRVVIGSLAAKQPELVSGWLKTYGGDKIVLALDVNINANGERMIATHGWQQDSGVALEGLLDSLMASGAEHVLCTDISRDGTLQGSNVDLYTDVAAQFPSVKWQASGGIGALTDIEALKPTGVAGVILGRALLEGKFTLAEAIACWQDA